MPWVPAAIAGGAAIYGAVKGSGSSSPAPDPASDPNSPANRLAAQTKDNDFSYGGDNGGERTFQNGKWVQGPNGAQQAIARDQGMGQKWADMQAPTTDYTQGNQSRGSQQDALSMMRSAANGNAPSAAETMMRQGNDQAVANSLAMAAGARGQGAMAGAQQSAMGNASAMSTTNVNNMGAMRAGEMANARGQYGSMASGLRGQDDARSQYGSNLAMQQRALGQQGQLGFEQLGSHVADAQLGARMAHQGGDEAHWMAQMKTDQASTDRNVNAYMGGINAVASVGGKIAT